MGDILEVIEAIEKAFNLNREDILKIKEERRKKDGTFDKNNY